MVKKKVFSIILTISMTMALLLQFGVVQQNTQAEDVLLNLFTNPSFESGLAPALPNGANKIFLSTEDKRTGNQSMLYDPTVNAGYGNIKFDLTTIVPTYGAGTYKFTAYYKKTSLGGAPRVRNLLYKPSNPTGLGLGGYDIQSTWGSFSVDLVIAEGDVSYSSLAFCLIGNDETNKFYVDDISLTKAGVFVSTASSQSSSTTTSQSNTTSTTQSSTTTSNATSNSPNTADSSNVAIIFLIFSAAIMIVVYTRKQSRVS